jgi:hypothetical protein
MAADFLDDRTADGYRIYETFPIPASPAGEATALNCEKVFGMAVEMTFTISSSF